MNSISSLKNVHKLGLFGDHNDKNENQIIKIKEIKNTNLFQVVKYKNIEKIYLISKWMDLTYLTQ